MSLIDLSLIRRNSSSRGSVSASHFHRPEIDVLETRECMSVASPTGLTLAALSPTQVKLTWTDVSGESGYHIFQWNGSDPVLIGTVNPNTTTFTATGLTPNQTQWFLVQSFDTTSSAYTNWASVNTPIDALTVPTNLSMSANSATTITLNWNDATGQTGYRIFMWNGTQATQIAAVAHTTTQKVSNLSPGQSYYFYVQAFNATNTANTDWFNATTQAAQFNGPTNLKAQTAGTNTVNLTWTDGNGEAGYRVYAWDGNSADSPILVTTLASNAASYQVNGLASGQQYWFYVQAFNNANAVANTAWANAITTPVAVLQAPTASAAAVGSNSITVSWTGSALAAGYTVYAWTGFSWTPVQAVASGTTSLRIDNLSPLHTYWYIVQAYTGGYGQIAYSSAVFANL